MSETELRFADRVRSPDDLRRLAEFERAFYLPLLLSAILPIVAAGSGSATDSWVSITVNVLAWLVFVVDLMVHIHFVPRYLTYRVGVFDLLIVVITAPWFLIPGLGGSQVLVVARLARIVRLLFISKGARTAINRLGKVGVFAAGMLLFCSWMAYIAESPTNKEFASFGDSLWWGVVTLTTVGYGDIVPITEKGRIVGVFLMFTGLTTLGLIAGTLASAFGLSPADNDGAAPAENGSGADVLAEIRSLRAQLDSLTRQLPPSSGPGDQ